MKSPYEFIYGKTRDGKPIDRLLVLNQRYINETGEWVNSVYNTIS